MSKIARNPNGTRHIDSACNALWRIENSTDVEWLDTEAKIYNEVYFRTKWLFGICIYDRKFVAMHKLPKDSGPVIGFRPH